jgi:hypothetical protein
MKEQAVAAEALLLSLDGAVGDAELAADLTQTGAADEAMEEGLEKTRVSQPVGGREGLRTEVPAAVLTEVPLHAVGRLGSHKEALLLVAPRF